MNASKLLILDLDNTIFETRTIPREVFEPLFHDMFKVSDGRFSESMKEQISEELWRIPFHDVAEKHQFSDVMRNSYLSALETRELAFDIAVYPDYHALTDLGLPMILVTSGTTRVQQQKIDALGIRNDFMSVFIDDRNIADGGKERIFCEIRDAHQGTEFLVIGDNPESEIAAAQKLEIPWLLIDRQGNQNNSERCINSFTEISRFL